MRNSRRQRLFFAIVLGVLVLSVAGCSAAGEPAPTDQQMIERLSSLDSELEQLVELCMGYNLEHLKLNPLDPEVAASRGLTSEQTATLASIASRLGIEGIQIRMMEPASIWFNVWYRDLLGPGGFQKGYAYCEETPREVVEELDSYVGDLTPQVEVYMPIEGNWYLYYEAVD